MKNTIDYAHGWINGRMGEGTGLWMGISVLVVILLVILIIKQVKK